MKLRLLDFIVCPICSNQLRLETYVKESSTGGIIEGSLNCVCGKSYIISSGLPIFSDRQIF